MSSALHEQPYLENWRWMSRQIRCAMDPDEPRLIDTVITIAGQSGNFELNVMLPIIAQNLLSSIELLANSSRLLGDKAIASFKVNEARLKEALSRNPILVTALNPIIGYQKAAEIAKKAYQQGRAVIDVALEHTDLSRSQLEELLNPEKLTAGGV